MQTNPTPWGQTPIAYTNGHPVYPPLKPVPVRKKQPRTMFITIG